MNLFEYMPKQHLLSDNAKFMRHIKRVIEKGDQTEVEVRNNWKVSDETKVVQLMEKIILPLEKIIYLYVPTQGYNYIPGTKKNARKFLDKKLNRVYAACHSMLFLNNEEIKKVRQIIDTVNEFVNSFSAVDGVTAPNWFELNPNLNFYRPCYFINFEPSMKQWSEDDFEIAQHLPFTYMPKSKEEVEKRERYFEYLNCYSYSKNFKWDQYTIDEDQSMDIFLMHELAKTLRLVFIDAFPNLIEK